MPDTSALLPVLLPEVANRMGHLPVVEPAEEIRLQLMTLLNTVISRTPSAALQQYTAELSASLCRGLEDSYHEIKKVASADVSSLAGKAGQHGLDSTAEKLLQVRGATAAWMQS